MNTLTTPGTAPPATPTHPAPPDAPPDRLGPGAVWPVLGVLLTVAIGVLGVGLIWDRVPQVRLLSRFQADAQERSRQQTRAEVAAQEWEAALHEGLRCAGEVAARLQLQASPVQEPLCRAVPAVLRQVLLLDAAQPDERSAQRLFGPKPGTAEPPLADGARRQVEVALRSQWETYALSAGADLVGIDQFVPVRGLKPERVLLLRYRAAPDAELPRLIDAGSADQGVPIARTRGLRLAVDDSDGTRRWMITVSWVLLSLLVLGLIRGRWRALRHRAALGWQLRSAQAAQREAESAAAAARDAQAEADREHAEAVRAATESQQAREALAREVRFRADIEDSSPVGLRVIDREGRLIEVNRAFCAASGWTREQLVDIGPPYPFWPPEETDNRRSQLKQVLDGNTDADGFRAEFHRPDGTRWLAQVRATRLRSGTGWILSSLDITADHERQRRIEKLEAEVLHQADFFLLGEQALQLAHDLASHVLAIEQSAANLGALAAPAPEGPAARELRSIENQTALVRRQLTDFALQVKGELHYQPVLIHEIVEGAMLLESERAKAMNARVISHVSADMPPQLLPRVPLMQVVRNLISNGLKAMAEARPENRRVLIGSFIETDPPSDTHPNGRHWLHLTVDDLGRGIDDVDKLFNEPQPGDAGGLGLGLWICQRWIQRMGGRISVLRTRSPRGTVMLIVLPYTAKEADHA